MNYLLYTNSLKDKSFNYNKSDIIDKENVYSTSFSI